MRECLMIRLRLTEWAGAKSKCGGIEEWRDQILSDFKGEARKLGFDSLGQHFSHATNFLRGMKPKFALQKSMNQ